MLRALPPAMSRRSRTITSNPRSINSCAAVMPATPPPRTMTLEDIFRLSMGRSSASHSGSGPTLRLGPGDLEKLDRPFLLDPEHDLLVHAEDKIRVRRDLQKTD